MSSKRNSGNQTYGIIYKAINTKNGMVGHEIDAKYHMTHHTYNKRIKEMLGIYGVKTLGEAKEYLKDKEINEVLKIIKKTENEREN